MGEKHFQRTDRAYHRSREKSEFMAVLEEEYYDPQIESENVGGGDPGIGMLMASLLENEAGFESTAKPPGT